MNDDKATKYANNVGGVSGDDNIASLWKDHFNALYNTVVDCKSIDNLFTRLSSNQDSTDCSFTVHDVLQAVNKQKTGKSAGPDGSLYVWQYSRLFVRSRILFNLLITRCHLPATFMQSIFVPLVKCKAGDLTDLNNYRAIALPNSLSKVLETYFYLRLVLPTWTVINRLLVWI